MTSEEGLVAVSLVGGVCICHYGLPSVFLGVLTFPGSSERQPAGCAAWLIC